ncbi:hypothetical protein, conserved [Plasmodium gonderi]|uniref:TOG domain-containing protein n=1 Tax=Plasmodium gonderi TaxID=77519 RepID=A0A1Y1JMI8_PLAGO|nr:hypothetical protein, conserved [Plasmodium gonderi]GAW83689.1 hypothetical protein, conserved [Plasmodium gonderi]
MGSKDKDTLKLKYKIIHISSNDKDRDVMNLLKNTGVEIYKPWLSEKNCIYPQEIILQIKPSKIKYLEFLSHEYAISKKIEIFVSNDNRDYLKAGFFRFNDNTSTSYCARELKYVYLPCPIKCTYIKLKLYSPYQNYLNTHAQVGLYYINIIPKEMSLKIISEITPAFLKLSSLNHNENKDYNDNLGNDKKALLRKKGANVQRSNITNNNVTDNSSEGEMYRGSFKSSYPKNDKSKINCLYEKLENKIKCFEKLKGECVAKEEYNMACELKKIVNIFIFLKNVITFLKGKKKKYVKEENYGKAKRLREKEIKIKIIIKNIEELKIIDDCSRKSYYAWLSLYYKELEFYEKEINKIMSNENIKIIKKNSGLFDQYNSKNYSGLDLNNVLLLICSDDEKKREMGFDISYKPFEDRNKKNTNFWNNNVEPLCLIIKRGISDPYYNIFVKSVVTLEKMLTLFQDFFFKTDNIDDPDDSNNKNAKYIKCIISALLKRLDDPNLDVVDICIKTIMMMLHNNFISFKCVFSTILSMLFYLFSGDAISEINEKIIVSLMSFYYSLINKYYTTVKNDINLKKVLEIISIFVEVDVQPIKQTSLDFFVNIYNRVENRNELFDEFLLNVSFDTKNLILNRVNQEEKEKTKISINNNSEKKENENENPEKSCTFINNNELLNKNCLNNKHLKTQDIVYPCENNIKRGDVDDDIRVSLVDSANKECYTTLVKNSDNKIIDRNSKLTIVEKSNLRKETCHSEIKELQGKVNYKQNEECEKEHHIDSNPEKETQMNVALRGLHKKHSSTYEHEKHESVSKEGQSSNIIKNEKVTDECECVEDLINTDEKNETDISPLTCKYCFKTDESFTEIGLEKHWIKKCPMLCTCPNCFLIVELVVIHDHFLSECSHSYMYEMCGYCNKIVKKSLLDFHVMNECNGKKTEYLSCYYCSLYIESFEIDKWRAHFLSCSKNPRLKQ